MNRNDQTDIQIVRTAMLIPTLCRDRHLERCLNSLKANPWAKYVDLYIGLDYPCRESHRPGYERILKLLEGDFSVFRSFHVCKRETNYGAFKNTGALFEETQKEYDQFIFSEDDNEFSENFLEYMIKALDYFRDDPDVVAVGGYSYPVQMNTPKGCNIVTQNAIFNMWGAGFWSEKAKRLRKDIEVQQCLIRDFDYNIGHYKFSRYRRTDYINFVAAVDPDTDDAFKECPLFTRITDISMGVYMQVRGKYQALPTVSKVRNHGFDGTGLFCQNIDSSNSKKIRSDNYDYSCQQIDPGRSFELSYDGGASRKAVFKSIDAFVEPGRKDRLTAAGKLAAARILGRKRLSVVKKMLIRMRRKKG